MEHCSFIFHVAYLVLLLPMKIFSSFPKSPPLSLPAHQTIDSHNAINSLLFGQFGQFRVFTPPLINPPLQSDG